MVLASLETAIHSACLLEVTARKPGNVHPLASFADCDWQTFADSADAIAPILAQAATRPLGETILKAVEATTDRVGRNTNLGMILLLAPLAAVPLSRKIRYSVLSSILSNLTIHDSIHVFEAIRLASPGGLGSSDTQDVATLPTQSLSSVMTLAADRDDVARQYAYDFQDVFTISDEFNATDLPGLERQIIAEHIYRLAASSDTLILRKCGPEIAAEVQKLARDAAEAGGTLTAKGRKRIANLDAYLRADGNRRNPGTTADLIAAALFVAIREERIPSFAASDIVDYASSLRRRFAPGV